MPDTATGSYNPHHEVRGLPSELERLQAQALLSWPREARILARLGLHDGLSVLEVGSGPGFVTAKILDWLPHSQVTALDADAELQSHSQEMLQFQAADRLHFVNASVLDTGLPPDSFDFAIARYLFQHLPDPVAAAHEIHRVLRPGGKLAIIDIDAMLWGIVDPMFPQVSSLYARTGGLQAARGGNRLIGRRLWRILKAAAFSDLDLEAFVYHSDDLGLEPFLPQMDPDRLLPLLQSGSLSLAEYQTLHATYQRFLASSDAYVLMAGFIGSGQKR